MSVSSSQLQVDTRTAHRVGRSPAPHAKLTVRLRAATVIPVSAQPIENGAVLIDDHGRIAAIGPDERVPTPTDSTTFEFPNAALIPGLINVHTHLELTDIGGPIEAVNFYEWIQKIRGEVTARTPEMFAESARRGIEDAWRHGTTTVADTGSTGAVAPALAEMFGRGVVYQEVFGPDAGDAETALRGLRKKYEQLTEFESERVKIGVSPHAPYSVSGDLYRAVADFAMSENIPTAAHIAESEEESDLIVDGQGRFRDALDQRNITLPQRASSPVQYLERHGMLGTDLLAIHCVRVDRVDRTLLASNDCAVASCPTSNRLHGHGRAPLQAMVDIGIRVGLGTDSVASVGTLDLFREARALQDSLNLSATETLRFLTLTAAAVLRMDQEVGSLDVGKWGDMTVVAVEPHQAAPEDQVIAASASAVLATFVAGRCVYAAGRGETMERGPS